MSHFGEKNSETDVDYHEPSHVDIDNSYNTYRIPLVRFFSRKLPSGSDPEDMVQQVFVNLMRTMKNTKLIFSRSLVFTTAKNVLIDHIRWRKSHSVDNHELFEDNSINNELPTPENILQGKQQLDSFFGHLDNLPLRCRQVFLLHRIGNMSQQEIAEHLGISRSTVQKHMMNAMAKLHAAIGNLEDL